MLKFEIPPWSHGQIPRERFRQAKATHRKFTTITRQGRRVTSFIGRRSQNTCCCRQDLSVSSIAGTITAFSF
jgi:hypothetical protein